ncbi:Ig-like domain-containing protein [Candidatus Bipolaricaulota sp. J31]
MGMKALSLVIIGAFLTGLVGMAEELPPPIRTLIVSFNEAGEIMLCDPEIAPRFTFEILVYPNHGALSGTPPRLVYTPDEGFYGEDSFRVAVYDAETEELLEEIYVEVKVLGPGGLLSPPSFTWNAKVIFSGPSFIIEKTQFDLRFTAKLYYFDMELFAKVEDSVFSSFTGTLRHTLELLADTAQIEIPLGLTAEFDPTIPSLKSWTANVSIPVLNFTLDYRFYFDGSIPDNSYGLFTLTGTLDEMSLTLKARFGGLTVEFSSFDLLVRGEAVSLGCSFCDFTYEVSLAFSKEEGFQNLSFTLKDLPVPCGLCGEVSIYTSLKITFTPDAKDVVPTLQVSTDWIEGCIKPYIALETAEEGFGLEAIFLYGIELKCEFANEIEGKFVTSFDPEKDASLTGDAAFFEYWRFEGPMVGCCEDTGRWQITLYFSRGTDFLFGFSKMKALLHFPLLQGFTVRFGAETGLVDPTDPAKAWRVEFGWQGTL